MNQDTEIKRDIPSFSKKCLNAEYSSSAVVGLWVRVDSICIDLSPEFIFSDGFKFRKMIVTIGKKNTGRLFLMFSRKDDLDAYKTIGRQL